MARRRYIPLARFVLPLSAAFWGAVSLLAECVVLRPPCDALKDAAYVFVADAVEAGSSLEQIAPDRSRVVPQPVRFKVLERFKGVSRQKVDLRVLVHSDNPEAVLFDAGKRYVVYASPRKDGAWDTACSRTRMIERDDKEVRQLRSCRTR
jgi:hypothetical protein